MKPINIKNILIPLYNRASPTENLCDRRKGQRVMFAPLGSYMHLEMCQSLMLTAEATLGQRSAPPRHWLDITQPRKSKKKKQTKHPVKMEITVLRSMSHMLWNIGADRGLGSRGFCGMWNEIKNDPCGLLMLTEGGEEEQKAKHSLSNHSLFPSFVKSSPFSRSWARQHRLRASWPCFPFVVYAVYGVFSRMTCIHYGAVHLGRMSVFPTRCMLFHVKIGPACELWCADE